ncbi:hypothetical protein CASFOL_040377 [Castilleja foliolosa]|uniref:Uncharacterized protein n=1 Tax=Castilleja foliolosa TaxID=1961234 RepID=A0ABD3BFS8_9LAMI
MRVRVAAKRAAMKVGEKKTNNSVGVFLLIADAMVAVMAAVGDGEQREFPDWTEFGFLMRFITLYAQTELTLPGVKLAAIFPVRAKATVHSGCTNVFSLY